MRRDSKIAFLVAGGAALAVAGAGAGIAATDALSPDERSQAVIEDAAERLGVEPSALSEALREGLKNRVDEAVEAGRLTEEQGRALKERIDSADAPLVFGGMPGPGFGAHVFGHGPGHLRPLAELDAAASFLGLTQAELRSELADGKSLAEIARAEGKSVEGLVQALVDAATQRIEEAVEAGKLTEARAAELEAELDERIRELVNREPGRPPGFEHRHPFGDLPGPGFRRFGGHDADPGQPG